MALREAGFQALGRTFAEFKSDEEIKACLQELQPAAVVYDLTPPYEASRTRLETLQSCLPYCKFIGMAFDSTAAQKAGNKTTVRVVARPVDGAMVVAAVRRALDPDGDTGKVVNAAALSDG
jgi:hypothetical protein